MEQKIPRNKKILFVLGGLSFSTGLCLIALEIFLRIFPGTIESFDRGFYPQNHFSFDHQVHYVLIRSSRYIHKYRYDRDLFKSIQIDTNAEGYREVELENFEKEKPLIVAIGDSFTEGYNVENQHTWPKQLHKKLQGNVQVLNLGVHNYSLINYLMTIKYKLENLKPDLIVVGLYVLNDVKFYPPVSVILSRGWIRNLFYFAGMVETIFFSLTRSHSSEVEKQGNLDTSHLNFPDFLKDEEEYKNGFFRFYRNFKWQYDKNSEPYRKNIDRTVAFMKQIQQESGVPVVFMVIPTREQTMDYWWKPFQEINQLDESVRFQMQESLNNSGNELHILDLAPEFHKKQKENLYLKFDGHWDEGGHSLGAEVLAGHLQEEFPGLFQFSEK